MRNLQIESVTLNELINEITANIKPLFAEPQQENKDKLMTRQEVAKFLGVSLVTVHNWNKSGILNPYRIGNKIRYKESEVLQSLQSINAKRSGNGKG